MSKENNDMFSMQTSSIKDIPFDKYEKNFTFILKEKKFAVPRIIADLFSPIISQFHYTDESQNEFTISAEILLPLENIKYEQYFQEFLDLQNFKLQKIDDIRLQHYAAFFLALGNINEYLRLVQMKNNDNDFNSENVIDRLIYFSKILKNNVKQNNNSTNDLITNLIKYAAIHFEEISKQKMKNLPFEIIEEIVKSDNLLLRDEDSLLEFILELYEESDEYSNLFEYIHFKNIKEETLRKFINEFNIDHINNSIWKSIYQRFFKDDEDHNLINEKRYKYQERSKIIEFKYEKNKEFEGIMHYLNDKTGGNIHDNKTIEIISNSCTNNISHLPKNLVDYQGNNSYLYHSNDEPNVYVCFNFKEKQIEVSNYTIKSFQNGLYLTNWVIEGSNDGEKWDKIDEHINDSALSKPNVISTFDVKNKKAFYSFIRLCQTGKNSNNCYYIQLRNLEFYGKLKMPTE